MTYVPTVTYKGEVARHGHATLEVDVAYNNTDTELAGVGDTLDLSISEGPHDGTNHDAPVEDNTFQSERDFGRLAEFFPHDILGHSPRERGERFFGIVGELAVLRHVDEERAFVGTDVAVGNELATGKRDSAGAFSEEFVARDAHIVGELRGKLTCVVRIPMSDAVSIRLYPAFCIE